LHRRLAQVDPEAAARIHPHDARRIVRALEVFERTGEPISDRQQHFQAGRPAESCRVFVLDWPRDQLHARINARCERMFVDGLVDEVRELTRRHGMLGTTAGQAVGYREALRHLQGDYSLEKAIERTQARSRQFARRQLIWYRRLSECRMVPLEGDLQAERVAERIVSAAD